MDQVRVLVVDDDAAVRQSLSTALGRDGYEVLAADGGGVALAHMAATSVDAIVLDVAMREPNGLEVCRRLRSRGDRTPILMLTARDLVDDRVAGLDAGADDYLVKPFALAELRARLLAGLTVAAAGITYGAARLTAGRILRPIAELTATAERVTQTRDLTARLRSAGRNNDGTNDEVGRLTSAFDTMLAALHESVTAQRQLVADASHELRTPLTSLTTNLDLLEDGAGLADPQAPALVRAAREQAGELDQLITDLLDLARYHESAPHREAVRLDLLTDQAVHRLRQRAPRGHRLRAASVPGVRRPRRGRSRRQQPGRQRCQVESARHRGARRRRERPHLGQRSRPRHRARGPPVHLRALLPSARRARNAGRGAGARHRRQRRAGQPRYRPGADRARRVDIHPRLSATPERRGILGRPAGIGASQ